MPSVVHEWSSGGSWQAGGTTAHWSWERRGEADHFWAYSVRPKQSNMLVGVEREWTTRDNRGTTVQHFDVRVEPFDRGEDGGLLMFNVIGVVGA
jgi:hypothetical protein